MRDYKKPRLNKSYLSRAIGAALVAGLVGCGGGGGSGGGSGTPTTPQTQALSGAGVNAPLLGATVHAYTLDLSTGQRSAQPVASGETNSQAEVTGLALPFPLQAPYILEFVADADTTVPAGSTLQLTRLRTIVMDPTAPAYATAMSTLASDLSLQWYQEHLQSGSASQTIFEGYVDRAAKSVKDTLGFGLVDDVDIFTTPPLINDSVDTTAEVSQAISYRAAANAALDAIVKLTGGAQGSRPDENIVNDTLAALSEDLTDGIIDNQKSGQPIDNQYQSSVVSNASQLQQVLEDALDEIDNTQEIAQLLLQEQAETSDSNNRPLDQTQVDQTQVVTTQLKLAADIDDDGIPDNQDTDLDNDGIVNDDDAFPLNASESLDTDGDGVGNNADSDDDGDGVADSDDDYPLDASRSSATDQDNDGWPSDQDPNDNDNSVPGITFVDTDGDGLADEGGLTPDSDDDNDGVADSSDRFPTNPRESLDTDNDGVGDNADTDDDGDNVADENDAFPKDPAEALDTDGDGVGNNADTDDDGDNVADSSDAFPLDDSESVDTDGDGVGNNADTDDDGDGINDDVDPSPLGGGLNWGSSNWDQNNWH